MPTLTFILKLKLTLILATKLTLTLTFTSTRKTHPHFLCGRFYFVCDHSKHRNAKWYKFWV